MAVIKRIKLNSIENGLEDIVSLSSRIKISQEELSFLKEKVSENREKLNNGKLSQSKYKNNEKKLQREIKRLSKNIDGDVKKAIRKIDSTKQFLNKLEL